jgi:dUTP pyrophosphatase
MAKKTKSKIKTRTLKIKVVQLPHARGLPLPAYQSPGAAGFDLVAAVAEDTPVAIQPGARSLIPTGLIFELPDGTEGQVRPRSGLALKHGVTVLNSPGTIDSDYRGEVQVILINLGREVFHVARGERIAQVILAPVTRARLKMKADVSATPRGAGGFGSTGVGTLAVPVAQPRKKSPITAKTPAASGTASKTAKPKKKVS